MHNTILMNKESEKSYLKMHIELEITNLDEVTKFMSSLVDINYEPFCRTWFVRKDENIQNSKNYIEENFWETYCKICREKGLMPVKIKKECKIIKIYDVENTYDQSCLYYDYELFDEDGNSIIVNYWRECNNSSGTIHDNLWLKMPGRNEKTGGIEWNF